MMIEKNIPIPEDYPTKLPFNKMEPGDSVYLTGDKVQRQYATMRQYAWRTGKKFVARSDDGGMRIWRVS